MSKTNLFTTVMAVLAIIVSLIFWLTVNEQKIWLENTIELLEAQSGSISLLLERTTIEEVIVITWDVQELVEEPVVGNQIVADCSPGKQPTQHAWSYSGNTQILNTWASKNNCVIPQMELSENAEFVIYLDKPTTADNQIHMRFKWHNAYGRLVSKAGDLTLVFDASNIKTYQQGTGNKLDFDITKALQKGDVTIQSYSTLFDWNYIDSISIID